VRNLLAALAVAVVAAPAATAAPLITMTGRGFGHGVGMSQYGAEGLAREGATFDAIIAHYYPGTVLEPRDGEVVRVLLREATAITFRVPDGASVVIDDLEPRPVAGALRAKPVGGGRVALTDAAGTEIGRGASVRVETTAPFTLASRKYRGALVISRVGGSVRAVNHVGLEDYVRGVIAWEMPSTWSAEALRAQAVAARSYGFTSLRPNASYDVFPDTRSQMYGGLTAERKTTDAAVKATAGLVAVSAGKVARTFFYSSSGGRTANVEDVWRGVALPYLVAVDDPSDAISPDHRWKPRTFRAGELGRLLGTGPIRSLAIARNRSGRVATLTVTSRTGAVSRRGTDVRTTLGLRSAWFSFRLLDLRRAVRLDDGTLRVTARSSPNGTVALEGLVDGAWVELARGPSSDERVQFDVDPGAATMVRLRAGSARSFDVAVP
jgi:stage II sporulation protein D